MPPALGLFSTTTGWPRISWSGWAVMRAARSVPPPAPKPTTILIVRVGQSWAATGAGMSAGRAAKASAISPRAKIMAFLPGLPASYADEYKLSAPKRSCPAHGRASTGPAIWTTCFRSAGLEQVRRYISAKTYALLLLGSLKLLFRIRQSVGDQFFRKACQKRPHNEHAPIG